MPYVKQKEVRFVKIKRLLLGYSLNPTGIAEILGCSWATASKKLNEPERFTLGELERISRTRHIPIDEIRDAATI